MEFLALLAGVAGLWLGTEATIKGAVAVADRLHVSEFIVGVAVLSIGSDLPELAIAVDAALKNLLSHDASDIVVGSALGSGLGQIGFVLGIAGLIAHLTLPKRIIYQHGGMLLGSLVLLALIAFDGHVSRTEGISLITVYAIYLVFIVTDSMALQHGDEDHNGMSLGRSLVYLGIGLVIVIGSAELTVSSATSLAIKFDIEQSFIAIVIIGLGSSLPELSISVSAALKRRASLSVGNLIGSNIFDTLVPIGVAATIANLEFDGGMLRLELPFLFALSALVLVFFHRRRGIRKYEAAIVLALYVGYATWKFASL